MMKRIKGSLFCLGLRKNSGFLSWKGSSLIAVRQKGFSLSAEAALGTALMVTAWAFLNGPCAAAPQGSHPLVRWKAASRDLLQDWETALGSSAVVFLCGKGRGQFFSATLGNTSHASPWLVSWVSALSFFIPCSGSGCISKCDAVYSGKTM